MLSPVAAAAVATALLALAASSSANAAPCPCAAHSPSLCSPITTPPRREVLIFHAGGGQLWRTYAWQTITTVVVFGEFPVELMCTAHAAGARIVLGKDYVHAQLGNATAARTWAAAAVAEMGALFTDGINLDIEALTTGASQLTAFTAIVAGAMRSAFPFSQLSFDTSIYPTAVAGGYDLVALAALCDFLVPMAYDMGWGSSPARANSPLPLVRDGINGYVHTLGIAPEKVVLGLPWYGYTFPCEAGTVGHVDVELGAPPPCLSTNFSGSWSRSYTDIVTGLLPLAPGDAAMDGPSASMWFDYMQGGQRHQVWYDDPASLAVKYAAASNATLGGIAVWTGDMAGNGSSGIGRAMWAALGTVRE